MEKMAEVYNLKEQEYMNKISTYEAEMNAVKKSYSEISFLSNQNNINTGPKKFSDFSHRQSEAQLYNSAENKASNEIVSQYNDLIKYMIKLLFRLNEVDLVLTL